MLQIIVLALLFGYLFYKFVYVVIDFAFL